MKKRSVRNKRYAVAGLLLSACFYTSAVKAMESESPEELLMHRARLSHIEAKKEYMLRGGQLIVNGHVINSDLEKCPECEKIILAGLPLPEEILNLMEVQKKSVQLNHEKVRKRLSSSAERSVFCKKTGIMSFDNHAMRKYAVRPRDFTDSLFYEMITYEDCLKCTKKLNKADYLIKTTSAFYLPINMKVNEKKEEALVIIEKQSNQIKELEEESLNRKKVFNSWRQHLEKKNETLIEENNYLKEKNKNLEEVEK